MQPLQPEKESRNGTGATHLAQAKEKVDRQAQQLGIPLGDRETTQGRSKRTAGRANQTRHLKRGRPS
jgi:hypothetical protein